ncbi:hypothetical protein BMT54_08345 [Pasteurellaceae bacterium 15-036681]|nr:hypothetical protein BMT54_08345 [Pasteurellaceae bacterium 15-036681]
MDFENYQLDESKYILVGDFLAENPEYELEDLIYGYFRPDVANDEFYLYSKVEINKDKLTIAGRIDFYINDLDLWINSNSIGYNSLFDSDEYPRIDYYEADEKTISFTKRNQSQKIINNNVYFDYVTDDVSFITTRGQKVERTGVKKINSYYGFMRVKLCYFDDDDLINLFLASNNELCFPIFYESEYCSFRNDNEVDIDIDFVFIDERKNNIFISLFNDVYLNRARLHKVKKVLDEKLYQRKQKEQRLRSVLENDAPKQNNITQRKPREDKEINANLLLAGFLLMLEGRNNLSAKKYWKGQNLNFSQIAKEVEMELEELILEPAEGRKLKLNTIRTRLSKLMDKAKSL